MGDGGGIRNGRVLVKIMTRTCESSVLMTVDSPSSSPDLIRWKSMLSN